MHFGLDALSHGTLFDDQADPGNQIPYPSANIATNYAYVSNSVATPLVPEEALGAFIGEDPNGLWTLSLRDAASIDVGTLNSWKLFLTTLPTTPVTTVKTFSNSTPLAIPDTAATISSTIAVSGAGTVLGRLRLTTNLAHASSGQIEMTLLSPGGRIVTITKQRGGASTNVFAGTMWDDEADPGSPIPYTGNPNLVTDHTYAANTLASPLVVEEALAAFNGENPNGFWTLTLRDVTTSATGTLYGWTIEVGTIRCLPAACPVNCDDANVCTTDICDAGSGCRHAPGPDADGDTVCDAADCAPADAGAFAIPAEVTGLGVSGGTNATISWRSAAPGAGAGTVHQVLRGVVSQLPVGTGGSETCLAAGLSGTSITDNVLPAAGSSFYYLVRGKNTCGRGTYGYATSGAERTSAVCP
jgi:subtilisin-like proprotein convertase family protein